MQRFESQICLLDSDMLDEASWEAGCENLDGSFSSGYESADSSSSPPVSSVPRTCPANLRSRETMVYTNTDSLCDSLQLILQMPDMCDVTFLVGEEKHPVYEVKAIMTTRSGAFYQLILHHQREAAASRSSGKIFKSKSQKHRTASKLQIPVPDYDADVFSYLVSYLHCGRVKVTLKTAPGLLCASSEFGLKDLHKACWDFLGRVSRHTLHSILTTSSTKYSHKKPLQKLMSEISDTGV